MRRINNSIKRLIPKGFYCHDNSGKACIFWTRLNGLPDHENGYCSLLMKSDYDLNEEQGVITWVSGNRKTKKITNPHEIPMSLLWDQCKECGINEPSNKEILKEIKKGDRKYD